MGPKNAYKDMLNNMVSPITFVNMNHTNQLEQMANEAMFATVAPHPGPDSLWPQLALHGVLAPLPQGVVVRGTCHAATVPLQRRAVQLLTVYFGAPSMFITLWFGFDYGTNPPLGTLII
jgi:hypothetical protein